jgi:DNA polymerase-3 subunit delta'
LSHTAHVPYFWQTELWQRCHSWQQQQRLPHALLLSGPAGLAKQVFAKHLIQSWICEQPNATCEPCQQCRSCGWWQQENHPDVCLIQATEATIPIAKVRELEAWLSLKPQHSVKRIGLILQPQYMTRSASHALLKTLEAPPAHGLFILVSDAKPLLLPTVRSRCVNLDFVCPTIAHSVNWLNSQYQYLPSDCEMALKYAYGAPMRAKQDLDSGHMKQVAQCIGELLSAIEGKKSLPKLIEQFIKLSAQSGLYYIYDCLKDLAWLVIGQTQAPVMHRHKLHTLQHMAHSLSGAQIVALLDQWHQLQYELLEFPGKNITLGLESLLLNWQAALKR